jgi:hypothetical protein
MAKQKNAAKTKELERERKNQNRLKSVRSDFLAGNIKNFQQIYDVVAPSWISEKLGMGYTTLRSKSNATGNFSLNEIKRYAELIGVDFEIFLEFVKSLMK